MPFLLFTHVVTVASALYFMCRYKVLKSPSILTQSLHLVFFFVSLNLLGVSFLFFCICRNILFLLFPFIASFSFVLQNILPHIEFLNDSLFFFHFGYVISLPFGHHDFLMKSQLLIHENLLYMRSYFLASQDFLFVFCLLTIRL